MSKSGALSIFENRTTTFTAGAKAELAGLMRVGQVTTATSSTIFESTDLIGQDDAAFEGWYVSVLQADDATPEGELQPMSAYESSTGKVTHSTFTAQLQVGDWVILLRPEIAVIGKYNTAEATGTIGIATTLMGYMKQVVTNTESLIGGTSVGVTQIAATTIDLNQAAATYDLFTGTNQVVILESLNIKMPTEVAGGALTSISIQTDDVTAGVIINSTDGDAANLTSEPDLYWKGSLYITIGTKIRLTIGGGAEGTTYVCNVTAKSRAVVAGGNLA